MQHEDERASVQREILLQVTRLRSALEKQGADLVTCSRVLADENTRLEETIQAQAASLEEQQAATAAARAEVQQLAEEARNLRNAEARGEEAERAAREQAATEQLLNSERSERQRLEGVRRRLESELHAVIAGRESGRRQEEQAAARMRLEEAEFRMRAEAEIAESRRCVELLRAEFASEEAAASNEAARFGGSSPYSSLLHEDAFSAPGAGSADAFPPPRPVERSRLEEALIRRDEELQRLRGRLAGAEGEVAAAKERADLFAAELAEADRRRAAVEAAAWEGNHLRRAVEDAERERQQLLGACSRLEGRAGLLEEQLQRWQADSPVLDFLLVDHALLQQLCREDARKATGAITAGTELEVAAGKFAGSRGKAWRDADALGNVMVLLDGGADLQIVREEDCRRIVAEQHASNGSNSSWAASGAAGGADGASPWPSESALGNATDLASTVLRLRYENSDLIRRLVVINKLLMGIERQCWEKGRLGYEPLACAPPAVGDAWVAEADQPLRSSSGGTGSSSSPSRSTMATAGRSSPEEAERLAGLARGSAAAVAGLLRQVRSLGDPRLFPEDAGAAPGSSPASPSQQLRAVRGLLDPADFGWPASLPGQRRDHRETPVSSPSAHSSDFGAMVSFAAHGTDGLTAAERGAALTTALEQAAGRLERLHARLKVLSPPTAAPV